MTLLNFAWLILFTSQVNSGINRLASGHLHRNSLQCVSAKNNQKEAMEWYSVSAKINEIRYLYWKRAYHPETLSGLLDGNVIVFSVNRIVLFLTFPSATMSFLLLDK